MTTLNLTRRDFELILAALMVTEDAADAFRISLVTLRAAPATDREVVQLAERIFIQVDPDRKIV